MLNYVFTILEKQTNYSINGHLFHIEQTPQGKEPRLYLKSHSKIRTDLFIFESPEYRDFQIEEIHVTLLPHSASRAMGSKKDKFKNSSPFHITLRLKHPSLDDVIIIHDFYSSLDNARDYHIQLHQNASITYLPTQIIHQQNFDQIIAKEWLLVQKLLETNQSYEKKLLDSVESTSRELFTLCTQANLFPESMVPKDYDEFLKLLQTMIGTLEELIHLGHEHEFRKLQNAKLQLAYWTSINPVQSDVVSTPLEVPCSPSKKEQAKKAKVKSKSSPKTKNQPAFNAQYHALLEKYFEETQALQTQKTNFLKDAHDFLKCRISHSFKPQAFLDFCQANASLFTELSCTESQELTFEFFLCFIASPSLEEQTICQNIAIFLSEHLPHYAKHIHQYAFAKNDFMDYKISPLLLAFLNHNMVFWEYMHDCGINFSDNGHILLDGIAGNLLHGMLILLRLNPTLIAIHINTFIVRLFQYIHEDGLTLNNMKSIKALYSVQRKKISPHSFFGKNAPSVTNTPELKKFKSNILEEPYGTIVIMDAIEMMFIRKTSEWYIHQASVSEHEQLFMSKLVEMISIIGPHVPNQYLLKAYERLLSLHLLGIFDDLSYHPLFENTPTPESSLALLSHFKLEYVGAIWIEPMNQLLNFFIQILTERVLAMSKNMLSIYIKSYFEASFAENNQPDNTLLEFKGYPAIQKLTSARVAYFLFSIKVQRGLNLTLADYQAMLRFHHCHFAAELLRFPKGTENHDHQNKVCLDLIGCLMKAIAELPLAEDIKIEIIQSKEMKALFEITNMLTDEIPRRSHTEKNLQP